MSPENEPAKHVALVGMTGVGKSTLVNVLIGSNRAKVTNDAQPCTPRPERYDIEWKGIKYSLWDTRGLNEALGSIARLRQFLGMLPPADRELQKFLRGAEPKINLIVLCIEASKIRVDAQWKDYNKIYVKFCRREIKVALVVTRMDENTRNTDWKKTCEGKVKDVAGEVLDPELVEALPKHKELRETEGCRREILKLISKFC